MVDVQPVALLGLGGVPFVLALVELVKRTFPALPSRFWPLCAVAIAVALDVGIGLRAGVAAADAAVMGLVVGLAASGLYSAGKELTDG